MTDLPRAVSLDQEFYADHSEQLARIADAITEQNDLLRQLAARADSPARPEPPAEGDGPKPVQLREPEPAAKPTSIEPDTLGRADEPAIEDKSTKATRTARTGRRSTKAGN